MCLCDLWYLGLANVRKVAYLLHVFGQLTEYIGLKTEAQGWTVLQFAVSRGPVVAFQRFARHIHCYSQNLTKVLASILQYIVVYRR
jgi:hypothetical protein